MALTEEGLSSLCSTINIKDEFHKSFAKLRSSQLGEKVFSVMLILPYNHVSCAIMLLDNLALSVAKIVHLLTGSPISKQDLQFLRDIPD